MALFPQCCCGLALSLLNLINFFFKHATHRPACSLAVPLDRTPLFHTALEMWTQPFVLAAASPLYRASLAVCISIKQGSCNGSPL